jgi:hypothetical protein
MPERRFTLDGTTNPEQKREHAEQFQNWLEDSARPVEGELEKTPEDLELINMLNANNEKNFADMGLGKPPAIVPEQVHFLSPQEYDARHKSSILAFCDGGAIYVNRERITRIPVLVAAVAHETYHLISALKLKDMVDPAKRCHRLGYRIHSKGRNLDSFLGLNESITEQSTINFMDNNKEALVANFKLANPEDIDIGNIEFGYHNSLKILNEIIRKVAAYRDEPPFTTWLRFERGYYSGEMMHLRDIAKAFDARAFQLISIAGNPLGKLTAEDVNLKVLEYLRSNDLAVKDGIYAELEAARDSAEREQPNEVQSNE